jgi:iron complex transport system substrate-binding protein
MNETRLKLASALLGLTALAVAVAGCSGNAPSAASTSASGSKTLADANAQPFQRTIRHAAGETVLTARPGNIALLDYSFVDYLAALDIRPGATVSFVKNELPPYLADRVSGVKFLGTIGEANPEAILAADPDLIIGASPGSDKAYDQLTKIAKTILLSQSEFDWRKTLNEFAPIVGKEDKAKQVLEDYGKRMENAAKQLKSAIGEQTVMFLRILPKEYRVYGKLSPAGSVLYDDLSLRPASGVPLDKKQLAVSMEALPDFDPDHIFLLAQDDAEAKIKELQNSPLWKNLKAVKNNRIYPVDQRLWIQGEGPIASATMLEQAVKELTK